MFINNFAEQKILRNNVHIKYCENRKILMKIIFKNCLQLI